MKRNLIEFFKLDAHREESQRRNHASDASTEEASIVEKVKETERTPKKREKRSGSIRTAKISRRISTPIQKGEKTGKTLKGESSKEGVRHTKTHCRGQERT